MHGIAQQKIEILLKVKVFLFTAMPSNQTQDDEFELQVSLTFL